MQNLEVSGAVRPIYGSLGVKRLTRGHLFKPHIFASFAKHKGNFAFNNISL